MVLREKSIYRIYWESKVVQLQILIPISAALAGYLIGSISFTRIVTRIVRPKEKISEFDVEVKGTKESYKVTSFGATAASMKYGPKVGCTIGLLDMVKVAIPVLFFRFFFPGEYFVFIAAAAGMAGHNWPIYYRFKGGRGISAYYGGIFVIDWLGAISTMVAGMIMGFAIFRDFFIAYTAGMWLLIPWAWFTTHKIEYLLYAIVVNILYSIAMIPDYKQYMRIRKTTKVSTKMVLETSPMGRGMLKISEWLRSLFKRNK
jgi:glycerol-3-phosphate acyltransferase PlsY